MSTEPPQSKNKHQKRKTLHSMLKSHAALTKKHSPNLGMRSSCPSKKNQPAALPTQTTWFSILTSRKLMTEIANPLWMPTTLQSPVILINFLGVPPQPLHIFHVHLCATPHDVHQNPHNTPSPMLPHGKCIILLSNHVICSPHHITYVPHHSEASHAWPLKTFSAASHCSHFWS